MSRRRAIQKHVLHAVAALAVYVACAVVVDVVLIFALGITGGPVTVANLVIAAVTGWRIGGWSDRQDKLEEKRSEVDS